MDATGHMWSANTATCASKWFPENPITSGRPLLPLQWIQTALWERHRVRTLRRTLEQIADNSVASLADDGSLTVSGVLSSISLPHMSTLERHVAVICCRGIDDTLITHGPLAPPILAHPVQHQAAMPSAAEMWARRLPAVRTKQSASPQSTS